MQLKCILQQHIKKSEIKAPCDAAPPPPLQVKATLRFALLALCNNVLEDVQSRTEAAEQTLVLCFGRRSEASFTQAPWGVGVSFCSRLRWWQVCSYNFRDQWSVLCQIYILLKLCVNSSEGLEMTASFSYIFKVSQSLCLALCSLKT